MTEPMAAACLYNWRFVMCTEGEIRILMHYFNNLEKEERVNVMFFFFPYTVHQRKNPAYG